MRRTAKGLFFVVVMMLVGIAINAESVYELRKLTEQEWLDMSTEDRLRALSTTRMHERDQTFIGNFGRDYDLYKSWGYQFYEMEDRYENYSFRGYEAYNIIEERRRRWSYNEFGDRIAKMRHSANIWKEVYRGDGTYEVHMPYDYINSVGAESGFVDGVWVARESTSDWAMSITGAGALRTKFTPLTLSIPNLDGISIDIQSANTQVKYISSAPLGEYTAVSENYTWANPVTANLVTKGGVMLRGGRFRRKFGVLTLGATYANTYAVQGNREKGYETRGTVSNFTPTPIMVAVRFRDDSPEDGRGGALVYNMRMKINGQIRDDIIPRIIRDDTTLDQTSAITDKMINTYVYPSSDLVIGAPQYDWFNVYERIPKYADYFYYNQMIKGQNSVNVSNKLSRDLAGQYFSVVANTGGSLEANGNQTLVYLYDLTAVTDEIYSIEGVTTVANDYRIETSMIYTMQSSVGGETDASGKPRDYYNATYWHTAAQSEGNIQDGSNVKRLSFNFGYQVASIVYGIDADFNYHGFKIQGEFVRNDNNYMFAEGPAGMGKPQGIISGQTPRKGKRWTESDNAYYVITQKNWRRFGFSGEIFKMGKNYKPWLDYFNFSIDAQTYGANAMMGRNGFSRVALIEDNDDDDMYPDTMLTQRAIAYRALSTEDPDGVFPGNDADNDGLPDNNKNGNGIPDYDEPFLMFDIDPDEFVFGNDYNNNTIPDFREDDMKMDTPYDLDRQGYHYFFRYSPIDKVDAVAGTMHTKGVGISNRTYDDYLKFILDYDVFDIGKFYAEYRYEMVQDNIHDQYIQVERSMSDAYVLPGIRATLNRFNRELYYDELEYKNSKVNRLFLDSRIRAVPSITIENHVKFENNHQIEGNMYDGTYQPYDELNTFAMVNKAVYSKPFGNFVFSPGIKYRFYKKARSESLQPLDHYLLRIPMIMLKYIVSENTDITFGIQGMPGMPLSFTDYVQSQNDFDQETMIFQVQSRSRYFGYNVWASLGVKFDSIDYREEYRTFEEHKTSSTFINIYVGW